MEQMTRTLLAYRTHPKAAGVLASVIAVIAFFYYLYASHDPDTSWGALSLLPTLLVLTMAVITRRPFEALIIGGFAGLIMLGGGDLISHFSDRLSSVMGNETIVWVILVCGLMGGLIALLEHSGCLGSFSDWLRTKIKSERQSLVVTAMIGVIVFIDDYLNCLAVSSSVKKLTDHYKVSREKLAYIIDSTAAPMCVIVPISTWAVFFAGLLEENGVADDGKGLSVYLSAIPFMAYAWIALILVFLVAFGVIGDFGPMKKAECRAKAGQPIPPDFQGTEIEAVVYDGKKMSSAVGMFNFLFPMALLVVATLYYEIDLLRGVLLTLVATVGLYYLQGILTFERQMEAIFDGFKVMLYPLSTVIAGFLLKDINDALGMTEYVIDSLTPLMSKELLPAMVFVSLALVVFGTASSWGVFIIAIPIVVPVAQGVDANMPLVIGALLSASSFGSHACFFSDSTVLAAQGAGCSPISHAFTQFPYALLGAVLSVGAFLVLGHMMA